MDSIFKQFQSQTSFQVIIIQELVLGFVLVTKKKKKRTPKVYLSFFGEKVYWLIIAKTSQQSYPFQVSGFKEEGVFRILYQSQTALFPVSPMEISKKTILSPAPTRVEEKVEVLPMTKYPLIKKYCTTKFLSFTAVLFDKYTIHIQ